MRQFRRVLCSTAARFFTEARAADEQQTAVCDRGRQYVVNRERIVRGIVAVVDQWEFVRRLNTQQHRARARAAFDRRVSSFDALFFQKVEDEIAHAVITDAREQRRVQPQPPCTDADIGRAAANQRREAGDFLERRADVVGIEVNGAAPHAQYVISPGHERKFLVQQKHKGALQR
jgi:hypothetical protein